MVDNSSGLFSYHNMRAFAEGADVVGISEYPLFSDANISGETKEISSPYEFINLVQLGMAPSISKPGNVIEVLLLRIFWCADSRKNAEAIADNNQYHGGRTQDELAALASLRLGIRLRAGEATRMFQANTSDRFGNPRAHLMRRPEIYFTDKLPILPTAAKAVRLVYLQRDIFGLKSVAASQYSALVKASRQFQDALWIAESEPNLAWLMLISAVETAANAWSSHKATNLEKMLEKHSALAERLRVAGGDALLDAVADTFAPTMGATNKFIKFALAFMPDPPPSRPPEYAQVKWSKKNFKNILDTLYGHRSRALHAGTPFPALLCLPPRPNHMPGSISETGSSVALQHLGGYWTADDMPINMNTFCVFVHGVLNRWWDHMVEQGNAADLPGTAIDPLE